MNTTIFGTDPRDIARAAALLKKGELVAFPTDTVYGLGADARSDRAVAKIFDAKRRPRFNPLIVHVSTVEMAEAIGILDGPVGKFLDENWPLPVSVVVPLRERAGLSPLVTAGQESVALRMPRAPVATALIDALGGPIAAPSANPSGRVSPTCAAHVLDSLHGKIAAVIDGGPCEAGVESTIVSFLTDPPRLLREGAFVTDFAPDHAAPAKEGPMLAPGGLASHYAPRGTVRLGATTADEGEFHIGFGPIQGAVNLSETGDLVEAASRLYAVLHEANRRDAERIAIAPVPDQGLGRAINDRLRRAAAPRP